jgi:hypothetical protein
VDKRKDRRGGSSSGDASTDEEDDEHTRNAVDESEAEKEPGDESEEGSDLEEDEIWKVGNALSTVPS